MARYRAGALRRADQKRQEQQSRYDRGRQVAHQAAELLKERWGASKAELNRLVQATAKVLKKFETTQDEDYIGTVALNLHSYYTGVERLLEDVARALNEPLPEEADWHRRLLRQMSAALPELRPPVVSVATRTVSRALAGGFSPADRGYGQGIGSREKGIKFARAQGVFESVRGKLSSTGRG